MLVHSSGDMLGLAGGSERIGSSELPSPTPIIHVGAVKLARRDRWWPSAEQKSYHLCLSLPMLLLLGTVLNTVPYSR